jgi:hypothetical protein
MAGLISVKVQGNMDKRLQQALLTVPQLELSGVVRQMLAPGISDIKRSAQALAPKETGTLSRTIKATKFKEKYKKGEARYFQTVRVGTRKELGIKEDALGFYPTAQEYGFREGRIRHTYFNRKAGRFVRSMGHDMPHLPRPFLRPAFYNNASSARAQAAQVASRLIPNAFKRKIGT